ncbi:MAG TPA: MFS transporter [Ktedonobacteraceae bacterium]|nr:MFS transporter [Ktedonobacteraceae bacterium]
MDTILKRLWNRSLDHYPENAQRIWYLALSVIATIILYYESYTLASVAPLVQADFKLSLSNYVYALVLGNVLGAVSAILGSLSDRVGRGNLIVYGLLVTGICTLLISLTRTLWPFLILYWVLGFIEGIILTVTPALVRDFSPRLGRAAAMGFWTVGPVGGSVLATFVASQTLPVYHTWQSQYVIAGVVGLVIFVICLFGLRELSAGLRDQIMNSLREKALIEARASGIDVEAAIQHPWRQMIRPRLIISSLGISLFLLIYYAAVGFFVIYLNGIFKFSVAEANGMVSIFWAVNVLSAIVVGFISDAVLVRKPFMVIGTVALIIVTLLFIGRIGQPTSAGLMTVLLVLIGICLSIAYVTWMAGYTETVEDINPALVATGLALWGFILRWIVVISTLVLPIVVGAGQGWGTWWWVCIAGQIVFLPTILTETGQWTPARARALLRQHEEGKDLEVESA